MRYTPIVTALLTACITVQAVIAAGAPATPTVLNFQKRSAAGGNTSSEIKETSTQENRVLRSGSASELHAIANQSFQPLSVSSNEHLTAILPQSKSSIDRFIFAYSPSVGSTVDNSTILDIEGFVLGVIVHRGLDAGDAELVALQPGPAEQMIWVGTGILLPPLTVKRLYSAPLMEVCIDRPNSKWRLLVGGKEAAVGVVTSLTNSPAIHLDVGQGAGAELNEFHVLTENEPDLRPMDPATDKILLPDGRLIDIPLPPSGGSVAATKQ